MVHRAVPTILLLLALGGCAAGPGAAPEVIPAGTAQLNLTRPSELLYASVKATVEVNGARVADIARDDGYAASIRAGRTTVSAFAASPPGRYTIVFQCQVRQDLSAGGLASERRLRPPGGQRIGRLHGDRERRRLQDRAGRDAMTTDGQAESPSIPKFANRGAAE